MKYEVYENNGGAVMLAILDDDCKPAAIFENWEYGQRGILADALQELAADPTAWRAWDSDLVERIASEWPYSGEAEPPRLPSFTTRSAEAMHASLTVTAI